MDGSRRIMIEGRKSLTRAQRSFEHARIGMAIAMIYRTRHDVVGTAVRQIDVRYNESRLSYNVLGSHEVN